MTTDKIPGDLDAMAPETPQEEAQRKFTDLAPQVQKDLLSLAGLILMPYMGSESTVFSPLSLHALCKNLRAAHEGVDALLALQRKAFA